MEMSPNSPVPASTSAIAPTKAARAAKARSSASACAPSRLPTSAPRSPSRGPGTPPLGQRLAPTGPGSRAVNQDVARAAVTRILQHRDIKHGQSAIARIEYPRRLRHPYDLQLLEVGLDTEAHLPSDDRAAEALGQVPVHERDPRATRVVAPVEITALHQRRSQESEGSQATPPRASPESRLGRSSAQPSPANPDCVPQRTGSLESAVA